MERHIFSCRSLLLSTTVLNDNRKVWQEKRLANLVHPIKIIQLIANYYFLAECIHLPSFSASNTCKSTYQG